jgi:hypothetical protein
MKITWTISKKIFYIKKFVKKRRDFGFYVFVGILDEGERRRI